MDRFTLSLLTRIKLTSALRERCTVGSRRYHELTGEIAGFGKAVFIYTGELPEKLMRKHNAEMERAGVKQEDNHGRISAAQGRHS